MKKLIKSLLAIATMVSVFVIDLEVNIRAEEVYTNLAFNKTATASSVYPKSDRTADKAVDGDTTTRWSSKRSTGTGSNEGDGENGTVEQWLLIDLEEEYTINEVSVNWEGGFAKEYTIQGSMDGTNFFDLQKITAGKQGLSTFVMTEVKTAQYIRILCTKPTNEKYGYNIYEVEVFDYSKTEVPPTTAKTILGELNNSAPAISNDGKSIVLPQLSSDDYEITLFGSDNKQVIDINGNIITPLHAMKVNLLYKVVNKTDETDVAYSNVDIPIIIPGTYTIEAEDNAKPNVVPGLREWKGSNGNFLLNDTSKIIISDGSLNDTAKIIQDYFKDMLGRDIEIITGSPAAGDIYLVNGSSTAEVGDEGYYLNVDDIVTITAPTTTGVLYGGISAAQILYQDETHTTIPKGVARDYPKYEVRSGMLDVGRMYIPLDYVEELTVYMAWFKMNEIQVHLNDYWSGSDYSAFRLESEVYPEIVATDGYYTKEEYKQYQKDMKKYGIDVISEIDTPYHAESFRTIPGVAMLSKGSLDIRDQFSYTVIENLFDEYLDGDDPVIQSKNFHIGTDEYSTSYKEEMRAWTDHFIKYVNDKGYNARIWGSLGEGTSTSGFTGTTPVSTDAVMNLWAPYWADVEAMYDLGYEVINTCGGWLYIVPAGNAGYPDRLDIATLYDTFDVNNFSPNRNPGKGTAVMPVAHPQTKGAEFAVWNDMTSFKTGFSEFDIFDRMKDAVVITSEKTWYGEKTDGQTSVEFVNRVAALENKAGNTNPGRYVESANDQVAIYDFEDGKNEKAIDLSANKYDGTIHNAKNKDGKIEFDGSGYLELPMLSVGYPYTVSMDVNITSYDKSSTLFEGTDGTLYLDIDDTGKVGYKRGAYRFSFDYEVPLDKNINLTFTCNASDMSLYVDGVFVSNGKLMDATIGGKSQQSGTFVLPVEKVMNKTKGSLDSINIYNRVLDAKEISDLLNIGYHENVALNKSASASSQYTNYQGPEKAVDGINNTTESDQSKQSRWASDRSDNQWIQIDLLDTYKIDQILITWEGAYASAYDILGSTDGENWFSIKNITGNSSGGTKEFKDLGDIEVQYIKIDCKTAATKYGFSIFEIEVYERKNEQLRRYAQASLDQLQTYTAGTTNATFPEKDYKEWKKIFEDYLELSEGSEVDLDTLIDATADMKKKMSTMERKVITSKEAAQELYDKGKGYKEKDYTKDSYTDFIATLETLKINLDNAATYSEIAVVEQQISDHLATLVKLDRSPLKTELDKLSKLKEDNYTKDSWAKMIELQANAKAIYDNQSLNQQDITDAVATLQALSLVKRGDISELNKLINSYNKDDYTEESWLLFEEYLNEAKVIIDNSSNVTQEQVDEAIALLKEAESKLVKKDNDNKDDDKKDEGDKPKDDGKKDDTKTNSTTNGSNTSKEIGASTGDATNLGYFVGLLLLTGGYIIIKKRKV